MDEREAERGLHLAQEQLTCAFERARATGYRSGSKEMHDLEQADLHYQHLLRLVHPTHRRSVDPHGRPCDPSVDDVPDARASP